jgi:hypothetical protein
MILTLVLSVPALLLQAATTAPDTGATQQSGDQATQQAVSAEAESAGSTKLAEASSPITDKSHPEYVRCRSERVIGSLAKRKKTCMTNREWEAIARTGNRGARDIVESQQVGMNAQ